jgi:hypothetical protein
MDQRGRAQKAHSLLDEGRSPTLGVAATIAIDATRGHAA